MRRGRGLNFAACATPTWSDRDTATTLIPSSISRCRGMRKAAGWRLLAGSTATQTTKRACRSSTARMGGRFTATWSRPWFEDDSRRHGRSGSMNRAASTVRSDSRSPRPRRLALRSHCERDRKAVGAVRVPADHSHPCLDEEGLDLLTRELSGDLGVDPLTFAKRDAHLGPRDGDHLKLL